MEDSIKYAEFKAWKDLMEFDYDLNLIEYNYNEDLVNFEYLVLSSKLNEFKWKKY